MQAEVLDAVAHIEANLGLIDPGARPCPESPRPARGRAAARGRADRGEPRPAGGGAERPWRHRPGPERRWRERWRRPSRPAAPDSLEVAEARRSLAGTFTGRRTAPAPSTCCARPWRPSACAWARATSKPPRRCGPRRRRWRRRTVQGGREGSTGTGAGAARARARSPPSESRDGADRPRRSARPPVAPGGSPQALRAGRSSPSAPPSARITGLGRDRSSPMGCCCIGQQEPGRRRGAERGARHLRAGPLREPPTACATWGSRRWTRSVIRTPPGCSSAPPTPTSARWGTNDSERWRTIANLGWAHLKLGRCRWPGRSSPRR